MTIPLEQRITYARARLVNAHQQFITEVLVAVRDASMEALERAFTDTLAARPRLSGAPYGDAPATADAARTSTPTEIDVSTTDAGRVLARVREAPGSHVGQLSQSLAMPASRVRRHLRQLADDDAIRIESTPDPRFGGQRMQTFFPHATGSVGTEVPVGRAEASA